MAKGIKVGTVNYRMGAIIKEFGVNSEVYKMAAEYIEEHIDKKFIKKDKKTGDITGLRQIEEKAHTEYYETIEADGTVKKHQRKVVDKEGLNLDNAFGRSSIFEEMMPKPQQLLSKMKEENKIEGSIKDNKKVLINLANVHASVMRSYDTTVDDIYDVRDDVETLGDAKMIDEAQDLLDEREKTSEWINKAKELVKRYEEAAQKARQKRN